MLNNQQNGKLNIRTMSVLAMFTAISVVLTRFLVIQPMPSVRFELGNVPIMLAGFMFGPVEGVIVGAIADFIGAMIRGQGFDIPLMLVPMFMGCMAGLVRNYIVKNLSYIKIMEILPIRVGVYTIIPIIEAAVIFGLLSNAAFRRIVLRGE